ncbi:hypothetical protein AcW1_000679 [Taiwanofungus camphoratus]|nr:hypothetical protein AcW1_000679 [Antrodia cinnamomea]
MASPSVWSDFEAFRHNVKHNTVDRLKQILTGFNEECGTNFTKSGKKQELIDRITREMEVWRHNTSTEKWTKGKAILSQVRQQGVYSPARMTADQSYSSSTASHSTYPASVSANHSYHSGVSGSSSTIPRYDPYAPPRRPTAPPTSTSSVPVAPSSNIRFKPSPFFRIERAVSSVVECPESTSAMDRRQQTLQFTINNDMVAKLNSTFPKYQLRLYCTSSSYYSPSSPFRSASGLCPIEFPPTCEVRVNSVPLTANLKGMKKKPGTAPPPDLGKSLRISNGASNRIEMVYVNSQQPVQSKKFYLVVMLVETTTVEQLIDRLKKGKYKSSQEILDKMIQASSVDDDIVAGHQKMSLKCPLSYMRISTPCRSSQCVHSQCFDALSWFSLMEQTTTWLCPVCEKALNVEDLIVDGYFDEILNATPEDVEDVIVEADGQWHSSDNNYGSAQWKVAHVSSKAPTPLKPASPSKRRSRSPAKLMPKGVHDVVGENNLRPSDAEIVVLDSDDEDEGRVKRELSPSYESHVPSSINLSQVSQPPRSQTQDTDVIDLTLDSDEEDSPPPTRKRKNIEGDVPSPTEPIWKKSRTNGAAQSSSPGSSNSGPSSAYMNGSRHLAPPPRHATNVPPRPPHGNGYYNNSAVNPYLPRTNSGDSSSPETWRS